MRKKEFEFSTARKIIFGAGKIKTLDNLLPGLGKRALIVKGKEKPNPEIIYQFLEKHNIKSTIFSVNKEPDINLLNKAVEIGRIDGCDFVIGFGGGASIDVGKAVSALLNNDGDPLDYFEVVGKGLPLENNSKPYIAIPTTSGTGSEVTKNAVISIPSKRVKVSMRSNYLIPDFAIIDPELTLSVPPMITASTGMDAFTQVIEPYVTKNTHPVVDMFCREAIPMAAKSLYKAYLDGNDIEARTDMAYVSLLGGLSLANAKLGAVHGFAGPIGGMFNAPHGLICATLLPSVMKINAEIVSNDIDKRNRFQDISRWITNDQNASIKDGVQWIEALAKKMSIPKLSSFGIKDSDFSLIIEKAKKSSSMKGNPVTLTENQMRNILELSL